MTFDMNGIVRRSLSRSLTIVAVTTLIAGCGDNVPVSPTPRPNLAAQLTTVREQTPEAVIATLRRVTARYHDLSVATSPSEGFVLLHDCETRLGDEQVGTVYFNPARLFDGVIDPEKPDALIYEPGHDSVPPKLVGVEFAVPFGLLPSIEAPTFQGATFQREDEFGVFGLHVWVWRDNPNGMFAESNPKVSCGTK
jgi:hypothetical protein